MRLLPNLLQPGLQEQQAGDQLPVSTGSEDHWTGGGYVGIRYRCFSQQLSEAAAHFIGFVRCRV